jgi:GTPase SAR1 family protein
MLGDASVGKSCLLLNYISNHFDEGIPCTIGIDVKVPSFSLPLRNT